MLELVDNRVLETRIERCEGSSPSTRTNIGMWCNGSTRASKPLGVGSIPTIPATIELVKCGGLNERKNDFQKATVQDFRASV